VDQRAAWEAEAENWVQWARTPGHDAYWHYRHAFFDAVVPRPGRATLEIGCGEGRVTRDLTARGHVVVALDASATLLRYASEADTGGRYVRADAAALPCADASFDIVVAYNSLMDFDDMPGAIWETARVLERGGALCICVTHPLFDAGGFEGDGQDAAFVLRRSYLGGRKFDETVVKAGITMRFRGFVHALEDYFSALFDAGFVVELLKEPTPAEGADGYERWQRYPMFLHIRAIKA
jgi:SAM-dependent methyltransferase